MATITENTALAPDVSSRLARLRWIIRGYVWLQGLALLAVCLALAFWVSLAFDWIFEPSVTGRAVILVLIAIAAFAVVYHWILRRLWVRLTDRNMAVLLERRNRELDDRLLTVVELSSRRPEEAGYNPGMLGSTREEVLKLVPDTDVLPVMNFRPLVNAVGLALILVVSVAAFAAWRGDAAQTWLDRSVLLGDRQWARATRIEVEDFPLRDGRRLVKVAKGSSLLVRAKADTKLAIPDALQIRYETDDGITGRPNMSKLKNAVPGRDPFQFFEYQFKNVQSSIVFDVVAIHGGIFGKNDSVKGLVIEAVDSPDLTEIALDCRYPEYLKKSDEQFSVRLVKPLPEGTDVTILAKTNKDLETAEYQVVLEDSEATWQPVDLSAGTPNEFRLPLGVLRKDTRVAFQLHDTDGVTNQQPIRMLIRIVPDDALRVEVQLVGIGKAVTPVADLPVRGTIWDDHGLSRTWFDYRVDADKPAMRLFPVPPTSELDDEQDESFSLTDLELEPGQKLSLAVSAADNFALSDKPNVGESQRYELQVVTEDELRAILETRERVLRRRFEGIIDEMTRMRDSLSRLSDTSAAADATDESDTPDAPDSEGEDPVTDEDAGEGARAGSRRLLRTEQAIQTSDRMRHETQEVAVEFDRILLELENNNVSYIEELQRRLGERISAPLKDIAETQFTLLDERLQELQRLVDNDDQRPTAAVAARRQVDVVLRRMDEVLKNMLELQKFNELLADLRKIIDGQKQVSKLTDDERERLKQRLKDELKKGLLD